MNGISTRDALGSLCASIWPPPPRPADGLDWVKASYDSIHGRIESNWRREGGTLAEIKTLRAKQGVAKRAADYDLQETLPTLAEIVDLVRAFNRAHGRTVGIAPHVAPCFRPGPTS